MKLTSGYKTVDITMKVWDKQRGEWKFAGENLAHDFFEAGTLPVSDEGSYVVSDVDYCIEMAQDWEQCIGDYYGEEQDDEERHLTVEGLTVTAEDIASVLRSQYEWPLTLCEALCKMAGMLDEWKASDADSFERTVEAAADKLDVKLYE